MDNLFRATIIGLLLMMHFLIDARKHCHTQIEEEYGKEVLYDLVKAHNIKPKCFLSYEVQVPGINLKVEKESYNIEMSSTNWAFPLNDSAPQQNMDSFGSTAGQNIFGSSIQPTSFGSTNLYGSSTQPTSFGSTNLYGSSTQSTSFGSTNLYGSSTQPTSFGSTNLFGSPTQLTPFGFTNPFGSSTQPTSFGSTNLLGSPTQPIPFVFTNPFGSSILFSSIAAQNIFGSSTQPTSFGSTAAQSIISPPPTFGLSSSQQPSLFGSGSLRRMQTPRAPRLRSGDPHQKFSEFYEKYLHTPPSQRPYHLREVSRESKEFSVIEQLSISERIEPTQIFEINNPGLEEAFSWNHKKTVFAKTHDLEFITKYETNEQKLNAMTEKILNNPQNPNLEGNMYKDNAVCLFHGSKANLDVILSEGLDEKFCNGVFGEGIYFADSPNKSRVYDGNNTLILCAVYLGDCIEIAGYSSQKRFDPSVRKFRTPNKLPSEKRFYDDDRFDSLVSKCRPGRGNEYVIYNKHQCCPIYLIHYNRQRTSSPPSNNYFSNGSFQFLEGIRNSIPPFVWKDQPGKDEAMPPQNPVAPYPLYHESIMKNIHGDQSEE